MKNWLALVVAVILGLIAVYGVRQYIGGKEKKLEQTYKTVRVVTAGERLKAGVPVKPEMLGFSDLPEAAVTDDHVLLRDGDRLVGQTIIRTVERGEPLMMSYFRQPVERLENRLHADERAVSLKVDAISGVAGNLTPGSHVDIIGTFPIGGAVGKGATTGGITASHTVPLLSNVAIIAIDSRTREEDYTALSTGVARTRQYSSVTVAATPQEANLLIYAQQYGQLTLTLRPPADSRVPDVKPEINDKNLLEVAAEVQKAREQNMKQRGAIEVMPVSRP